MSPAATVGAVETEDAIRSISESFERLALSARRSMRQAAAELAADLPPSAWAVLREVLRSERVQASTIITTLGMDKSAVSRHLKELRAHGLVDAERDERDARNVWVLPTPLARERAAAIRAGQQERLRALLGTWEPHDLERFAVLLDRFAEPAAPRG
jgi:DNA-binding MarR family transcriptional regulator